MPRQKSKKLVLSQKEKDLLKLWAFHKLYKEQLKELFNPAIGGGESWFKNKLKLVEERRNFEIAQKRFNEAEKIYTKEFNNYIQEKQANPISSADLQIPKGHDFADPEEPSTPKKRLGDQHEIITIRQLFYPQKEDIFAKIMFELDALTEQKDIIKRVIKELETKIDELKQNIKNDDVDLIGRNESREKDIEANQKKINILNNKMGDLQIKIDEVNASFIKTSNKSDVELENELNIEPGKWLKGYTAALLAENTISPVKSRQEKEKLDNFMLLLDANEGDLPIASEKDQKIISNILNKFEKTSLGQFLLIDDNLDKASDYLLQNEKMLAATALYKHLDRHLSTDIINTKLSSGKETMALGEEEKKSNSTYAMPDETQEQAEKKEKEKSDYNDMPVATQKETAIPVATQKETAKKQTNSSTGQSQEPLPTQIDVEQELKPRRFTR